MKEGLRGTGRKRGEERRFYLLINIDLKIF